MQNVRELDFSCLAGEMTASVKYGVRTTQVFDANGNVIRVERVSQPPITMIYDKENRETVNSVGGTVVTYSYSGDGLKRTELAEESRTTLIWDGSEYLGEIKGKP